MLKAPLSRHLKYTCVTLFKAVLSGAKESDTNTEAMNILDDHMLNLAANNIDLVASQVNVINLECCHEDILEKYDNVVSDYVKSLQRELSSVNVNN